LNKINVNQNLNQAHVNVERIWNAVVSSHEGTCTSSEIGISAQRIILASKTTNDIRSSKCLCENIATQRWIRCKFANPNTRNGGGIDRDAKRAIDGIGWQWDTGR
jgi:hypothetical protein